MLSHMNTLHGAKKASLQDWHPADIVAALRKRGWSLRRLSAHHGYHLGALANAIKGPWPRGELLIAEALGTRPERIWPSRYDRHGNPNRGRKMLGPRVNVTPPLPVTQGESA